jgi:nitrite reductase/ring-hydroxylating ferredoxin subunit
MAWNDHAAAPPAGTILCPLSDVPDGGVREFIFGKGTDPFRMIVVRRGDDAWAYINRCPHFLIPMNTGAGGFLTVGHILWCGQHSAQFRFEDGYCIDGPCKGGALEEIPLTREGEILCITGPAA